MLAKAGCEQVLVGMVVGMDGMAREAQADGCIEERVKLRRCDPCGIRSCLSLPSLSPSPHSQFHSPSPSHSHPRARPYKEPPNPAICEGAFFDGCVGLDCSCAEIV